MRESGEGKKGSFGEWFFSRRGMRLVAQSVRLEKGPVREGMKVSHRLLLDVVF